MRVLIAVLIATLCLVPLVGCAAQTSNASAMDRNLETAILNRVGLANGVFVSQTSSGFGVTELLVRLYLNTSEQADLIAAVDAGLRTAWLAWPSRVNGVELGVVVGPKQTRKRRHGRLEFPRPFGCRDGVADSVSERARGHPF
jgi:hypothetical protein